MVSKKSSRGPVSKISSAATPAAAAATQTVQKSSVLHSAFSPTEFQLALFASVIQSFDSQHLRVHDTNSGRLRCEHALGPKTKVHSLDWGVFGPKHRQPQSKKKRKRSEDTNGFPEQGAGQDAVVALATSDSDVKLFSPAESRITGTLSGGHERGVRSFRFTERKPSEGWSIGFDGKLVQWDCHSGQPIRTLDLPTTSIATLARPSPSNPPVLCASSTPYLIDIADNDKHTIISFDAFPNPIHTLIRSSADLSSPSEAFLASDSDRHIHVYNIKRKKLLRSLIAESEVESLTFHTTPQTNPDGVEDEGSRQILAAVTRDGTIEMFSNPFIQEQQSNPATSLKARRKGMTRKANAAVKIIRPDASGTVIPVFNASFQGSDLLLVWADGGVNLTFERVRWQDEQNGELVFQGTKEVVRGKGSSTLGSAVMEGVKDLGKSHVDESQAIVVEGGIAEDEEMADVSKDTVSVSSDEEEGDEDLVQRGAAADDAVEGSESSEESEVEDEDVADADTALTRVEDEDADADDEPTFGELLKTHAAPIDIASADIDSTRIPGALVPTASKTQPIPSGVSLSTVLTQSLRTNDTSLLESCFHTTDTAIIRATIQRLDTTLAPILLQRLAERLARRPGRYGQLLVWVQWLCVAHGGALAGRADIMKKFSGLFKVLDQRSRSLDSLLLLKGKLDMLDAQMGLRREMQSRAIRQGNQDLENVIYIEGQEAEDSSDEDMEDESGDREAQAARPKKSLQDLADEDMDGEEDEDEDALPLTNGVGSESEGEEEEDEASEADALVDEEAEESDAEGSHSSDDEDEDEDDESDQESEALSFINDDSDLLEEEDVEEEEATASSPPPPPAKKSRLREQPPPPSNKNTPNGRIKTNNNNNNVKATSQAKPAKHQR